MTSLSTTECLSIAVKILQNGLLHALALRDVLTDERTALVNKDTQRLSDTAVNKQLYLNELEAVQSDLANLSASCGFGTEPDQFKALAMWCDDDSLLLGMWDHFVDVVRDCNELNSSNGAIIHVRQEQIKAALALLRDGIIQDNTYGPGGKDSRVSGTRSLAEV